MYVVLYDIYITKNKPFKNLDAIFYNGVNFTSYNGYYMFLDANYRYLAVIYAGRAI